MTFVDPDFTEVYNILKNSKKLEKFLIKNAALITSEDFYDNYGLKSNKDINSYIKTENKKVYEALAQTLLDHKAYISSKSIRELVAEEYLFDEIKEDLGFNDDTTLNKKIYWEIFFTYKYCYTSSFFQNNWEFFVPECDFEELSNNDAATSFLNAIMNQFDKLDCIISDTKKFKSYSEIPFEYVNYLSQLLGLEQKTLMMDSDMEGQYRILAANILDVYAQKGTPACFELLFNLLGFSVTIEEYYFDRRRYFATDGTNLELSTSDVNSYKFYLTTKNPIDNYKEELATNETVTPADISEQQELKNFDELVDEYGLMCVLGYDDCYEKTSVKPPFTSTTETYTGPVYKYFKTNYLRIKPTLKFESGNFTTNQLYQLGALLTFMTPEFCAREMIVSVDTGDDDEKIVLNWTRNSETDDFYMLDSEDWNQFYANKFISNYKSYVNSEYSITPKVKNDLGESIPYVNSLGISVHESDETNYNTFMNPISEKINLINTTKYWGDKVKISDQDGNIYPIWRTFSNYTYDGKKYYETPISQNIKKASGGKEEGLSTIYLPGQYKYLSKKIRDDWDNINEVDLNGTAGRTLRNYIKSMKNYTEVAWKTSMPIELFLKEELTDAEYNKYVKDNEEEQATRTKFFTKEWKKVPNYTWTKVRTIYSNKLEELHQFVGAHSNIINYDYVNDEILCNNDFTNLAFTDNGDGYTIKSLASSDAERKACNTKAASLLAAMDNENVYYISVNNTKTAYSVYKKEYVKTSAGYTLNDFRPTPDNRITESMFTVDTYLSIIENIEDDYYTSPLTGNKSKITSNSSVTFYVTEEGMYYKPLYQTTNYKAISHYGTTSQSNTVINMAGNVYDYSKTKAANKLGSFYFENVYDNDENIYNIDDTTYTELKKLRNPAIYQYRYSNIHKNDLIYSTADEKLYVLLDNCAFASNDSISCCTPYTVTSTDDDGNITITKKVKYSTSSKHVYGVKEVEFQGKLNLDDDNVYRIYEYDNDYKGFNEQDDIDNYIFSNFEKSIDWTNLNIQLDDMQRPTRPGTDQLFDDNNTDNLLAKNILKEICAGSTDNFVRKDLVTWKV